MRSTPYTTKQAKTIANNRKHKKTPPDKGDTHQLCLPRRGIRAGGRIHSRTVGMRSPRKGAHRPAAQPIQPIKPSKNSRTSHTNKQTRRKTLRQHSTHQHKSALCYKMQTHASHRAKKQKTVLIRISQENLSKARKKHRKNTVFHVKHSIFYLLIFHKHIGYHIAKSMNCRKTDK